MDSSHAHNLDASPASWIAERFRWWPCQTASLSALAGLAYYLAALIGLRLGLPGTSVSPVWIASGVALAAVLLCGRRVLVGVWIGAVLAQLTVDTPFGVSAVQGLADVIEPLIAAQALFFFCGRRCRMLHIRDATVLLVFGAGLGAVAGASIGTAALVLGAGLPPADFWTTWFTWWLGDACGLILITPLIVYLVRQPTAPAGARRLAEGGALLALIGAMGVGAFSGVFSKHLAEPLQYLLFVVLVLIAFRFGPRLTIVSANLLAGLAVLAAANGSGPFMLGTLNESLLFVQTSMIGLGVTGLLLAIIVHARRLALHAVEAARDSLEATVRERTAELADLASHDALTGLANRRAFNEGLARAVSQAARGHRSALLFGDLDGFKECNDTRGHTFGDTVLVKVAAVLRVEARQGDLVARAGGDEFALLLDGAGQDEALRVGVRLKARLAELSRELGAPIAISLGLVVIDGSNEVADVLSTADAAMYDAKAAGGGHVR